MMTVDDFTTVADKNMCLQGLHKETTNQSKTIYEEETFNGRQPAEYKWKITNA